MDRKIISDSSDVLSLVLHVVEKVLGDFVARHVIFDLKKYEGLLRSFSQAKPSQAKPSQAKPSQAKPIKRDIPMMMTRFSIKSRERERERERDRVRERERGKKVNPATIRKKVLCSQQLHILSNSIKSRDNSSGFNEVWSEHCWHGRCTGRDMDRGRNVMKNSPSSFHSLSDLNPFLCLCLCQGFGPLPLLPFRDHEARC